MKLSKLSRYRQHARQGDRTFIPRSSSAVIFHPTSQIEAMLPKGRAAENNPALNRALMVMVMFGPTGESQALYAHAEQVLDYLVQGVRDDQQEGS